MEALKLAPNTDFNDWIKLRIQQWSTKQINYKEECSDLITEAQEFFTELKTTKAWKQNHHLDNIAMHCNPLIQEAIYH
jgi:hypothetical protein